MKKKRRSPRGPKTVSASKGRGRKLPKPHRKKLPKRRPRLSDLFRRLRREALAKIFSRECGPAWYFDSRSGVIPSLHCWLKFVPEVRQQILWQTPTGDLSFDSWSDSRKTELYLAFDM